jgi:hypothetical protein
MRIAPVRRNLPKLTLLASADGICQERYGDTCAPCHGTTSPKGIAVPVQWNFVGWCYDREQRQVGPVATAEIIRLLRASVLQPEDKVLTVWNAADGHRVIHSRAVAALDFESH